ncbi:hypothetical protein OZN62_05510 [Aurantiacibacter sp. MUD11]|uniref:hypothetical protein n=1 Tax=Aurantiacibacter sp. MUD11 TaxID=3003265 RepID=UPI0022AB353A|nr:hypothetical protein [Aurantiacibacter sp. MUD11]WAT19023.1 hypothetical protein OZN62_05510 [Aurantiacibacter sp. MUD11]
MTHYLAIITAYSAVAVLAWLAALLQPAFIPPAAARALDRRWLAAGQFALAILAVVALRMLHDRGWLLPETGVLSATFNQVLQYLPIIAYLAVQRSLAAAFVPAKGALPSLATGVVLAVVAALAYFSVRNDWGELPHAVDALFTTETVAPALALGLQDLTIAALLALIADGWSRRTALVAAIAVFAVIHLPIMFADGVDMGGILAALANTAVVAGTVSAVLVTRNVLWFLPPHLVLALAPLTPS